jgi:hypothetical protein
MTLRETVHSNDEVRSPCGDRVAPCIATSGRFKPPTDITDVDASLSVRNAMFVWEQIAFFSTATKTHRFKPTKMRAIYKICWKTIRSRPSFH